MLRDISNSLMQSRLFQSLVLLLVAYVTFLFQITIKCFVGTKHEEHDEISICLLVWYTKAYVFW